MLRVFGLLSISFLLLSLTYRNINIPPADEIETVVSTPIADADNYSVLPFRVSSTSFQPLRDTRNTALEAKLATVLKQNKKWVRMIRDKKMSVGLVDITNPTQPRFATVNGDEMMYAASLPKIAVLLTAVDAIDKGDMIETAAITKDMNRMICNSDNRATTRMIDRLGFEKIAGVMTAPRYKFYDKNYGGGIWVGKRYAASGKKYPDPMKKLSHAATTAQICRFYYQMAYGQLVSHSRSQQMLNIMDEPALHHKFVHTLDRVAPGATIFRKSGSWSTFHSDSAMVWDEKTGRKYILAALVNDASGEQIIRKIVTAAETALRLPG